MATISDCLLIDLPKILDKRGNLSVIEQFKQIPFKIERVYWIYDVPGGATRSGHIFQKNDEFIVAISGSFAVIIGDGNEEKTIYLNRSYKGLYIPRGIWRELVDFSTNSLALIVSSIKYDEDDYIWDYEDLKNKIK